MDTLVDILSSYNPIKIPFSFRPYKKKGGLHPISPYL